MRIPVGILLTVLIGASGCVSTFSDPLDRRGQRQDGPLWRALQPVRQQT